MSEAPALEGRLGRQRLHERLSAVYYLMALQADAYEHHERRTAALRTRVACIAHRLAHPAAAPGAAPSPPHPAPHEDSDCAAADSSSTLLSVIYRMMGGDASAEGEGEAAAAAALWAGDGTASLSDSDGTTAAAAAAPQPAAVLCYAADQAVLDALVAPYVQALAAGQTTGYWRPRLGPDARAPLAGRAAAGPALERRLSATWEEASRAGTALLALLPALLAALAAVCAEESAAAAAADGDDDSLATAHASLSSHSRSGDLSSSRGGRPTLPPSAVTAAAGQLPSRPPAPASVWRAHWVLRLLGLLRETREGLAEMALFDAQWSQFARDCGYEEPASLAAECAAAAAPDAARCLRDLATLRRAGGAIRALLPPAPPPPPLLVRLVRPPQPCAEELCEAPAPRPEAEDVAECFRFVESLFM